VILELDMTVDAGRQQKVKDIENEGGHERRGLSVKTLAASLISQYNREQAPYD
jgi:hypothetical protein